MNGNLGFAKSTELLRRLWQNRFTQPGLLVLAIGCLGLSFWSQYKQFPYYWVWDMDQIQVADLLLIQSGYLPDNMSHTAYGMNLLFSVASRVAYSVGMLSAIDLEAVRNFVNPALAVGQLMVFLRALSPFAVLLAVAGTWWALRPMYRQHPAASLGVLLALGFMPWTAYHATMIRVELYSVLYWAGGTALLFSLGSSPRAQTVRYLLAGLCMGLSYLTKVQSVPLIGLSCLLALTWRWSRALEDSRQLYLPLLSHRQRVTTAAALLTLYIVLAVLANASSWPSNYAGNLSGTEGANLVFAVLAGCLVASVALAVFSRRIASKPLLHLEDSALLLLGGVLIAVASHLFLLMPRRTMYKYLLANFKVGFFLTPQITLDVAIGQTIEVLGEFWPLIGVGLVLVFALARILLKAHSRRAVPVVALLALSLLVAIAGAGIMTRPYLRDSIWLGLALGFPILIVGGLLANRFPSGRVRAVVLVCTIGIVLVYDSYSRIDLQGKLDANYNLYGWQRDMLFRYRYGENQRHYIDALSGWAGGFNFSAHETLLVTRQIEDFDRIQRTLEYVLWNVPLETLRIGTVVTGGRVTHAFPGLYFGKVTPELEGTTLYDMSQIQPSHRTLPRRGAVTRMMETDKKIPRRLVGGGGPGLVALLGRRDLSIWLFLPNGVCSAEATKYFGAPGDAKLWARHQGGGKTLHVGYPLRGYATIPASCFKASGFLVVREW